MCILFFQKSDGIKSIFIYFMLFIFCLFYLLRATPTAYGQARGRIGTVAAGLHTATATPDP